MSSLLDFFGSSIEINEVIFFLKKILLLKEICQKIIYQRIIEQTAQAQGLTVTSLEIQAEIVRLRREGMLEEDTDIQNWLVEQMITQADWEAGIRDRLLSQKLATRLFDSEVKLFFEQHKNDFDQFVLYQIVVESEVLAREILYELEENEVSFYEAAHFHNLDENHRYQSGYEGKFYRRDLPPDIVAALSGEIAAAAQVICPFQTEVGYHLLMVEEFIPAQLNSQLYQDILNLRFQQWLAMELSYLLQNHMT